MVGTDEAASGAIPGNTLNFEEAALPHLKSAFNLARWITRSTEDAEDVVQEAYLRAWRFFPSFRGGHARVWLMKIVRNTCYTWITTNRPLRDAAEFDEQIFSPDEGAMPDAEARLIQRDYAEQLHEAINELRPMLDDGGGHGVAAGNRGLELLAALDLAHDGVGLSLVRVQEIPHGIAKEFQLLLAREFRERVTINVEQATDAIDE